MYIHVTGLGGKATTR